MSNKYEQMGFVTMDEIQNVFTTKLTELEQTVFTSCPSVERRSDQVYLMSFFDGIRQILMSRARGNLEHYLKTSPSVKAEERKTRADEAQDKNRQGYEDRVRLGRQNYGRTYGS